MKSLAKIIVKGFNEEVEKINSIFDFVKKNVWLVIVLIVTAVMTYGYEITNFSMSIDEERNMTRGAEIKAQLVNSRYSSGFIHAILPHKTLPFWYEFIFLILLCAISICLAAIVYQFVKDKIAVTLLAIVFVSMPIHTYTSMFSLECITLTMGYLCAIAGVHNVFEWGSDSKKIYKGILGVIYITVSFGFGQSFVPVYISLVCLFIICMTYQEREKIWNVIGKAIIVFVCSLIMFFIINRVIHCLVIEDIGYLDEYFRWGSESVGITIHEVLETLKRINLYPVINRGYNTLPIFNLLWVIVLIIGLVKLPKNRIEYFLGMLGLMFANNLLTIVLGGYLPPRTGRAIPVFSGIIICMLYVFVDKRILKKVIVILACFIVVYQSATAVELNYMDYLRQARDMAEVERVSEEIRKLGLGTIPDKGVAFVNVDESLDGYWYSDNTFAVSYFTIGVGKLQSYFECVGYPYHWCSEEELQIAHDIVNAKGIPRWPLDGSIVDVGEMIIVNFGAQ